MRVRSINTVKAAIATLREGRWVEVRQIGDRGHRPMPTSSMIAWRRTTALAMASSYGLFSATIVVSGRRTTPTGNELGSQLPLRAPANPVSRREAVTRHTGPGLDPPPANPLARHGARSAGNLWTGPHRTLTTPRCPIGYGANPPGWLGRGSEPSQPCSPRPI